MVGERAALEPVPCVPVTSSAPHSLSTGLEQKNTKSCEILPKIFTVTFENNDDFYKPGIPYTGTVMGSGSCTLQGSPASCCTQSAPADPPSPVLPPLPSAPRLQPNLGHLPFHLQMLLTRADGAVMPQKQLLLIVHQQGKDKSQTFLTDRSGRVFFELETSGWSGMVTLHVSDPSPTAQGAFCSSTGLGNSPSQHQ